jgi:hypothetical protein
MGGKVSFPLSDRVLRPDYLEALESRDTNRVRAMREECEAAESSVSFARRVLQGRLDIVGNELTRRRSGAATETGLGELINRLPQILADDAHCRPNAPAPAWRVVDVTPDHVVVDELVAAIDAVAPVGVMSSLAALSDDDVAEVADHLQSLERDFSDTRHELHRRIDALKAELTSRYERGEVSVDGLFG